MPLVDEMAIIQLVRARREDNWTLQMIADALNADKVPAKKGGLWYARTLKNILENSIYRHIDDASTGRMLMPDEDGSMARRAV